ncbi:MAG TPA: MFS transporter [Kouleothrix sp.]|uniref:MFS transporter n=1 Tax=Kouleothrix sp. TaxID=2779161 RepID=UPI002B8B73F2|nr:MFS transporter [Kouleothrix sp.]HRC75506.1 MFS transporter [Kouleothrix sp.]
MESTPINTSPTLGQADTLTSGQLAAVTLGRLALNVAYRIVYPLQPFLAGRLHVDLRTVSALVTVQVLASVAGPLGGALADARGERTIMAAGLVLLCCGAALCTLSTTFGGFLAGYALIGLAVALYQPSAQAYLSARTSYARRGRALGVFETSWAGAALLGVAPLMQLVQATGDTSWSFGVIFLAALCSLALVRFGLPQAPPHPPGTVRPRTDWRALRAPSVLGMLALLFCSALGVDLVFIVQGAWLKTSFGATEGQLGQVFALLGVAELGGSLGSTALVDRVGKKRAVLAGYTLTAVSAALLPLSDGRWLLFLPLFFLFDLCFEFSIVSAFPLASGVAPALRGTVLALCVLMSGTGRATGSQLAEPLWQSRGIWATGLLSAAATLLGVALCWLLVREAEES